MTEALRYTEELLRRVRGEFLEMPGLRLTEAQARRLWNLEPAFCQIVLNTLVEANFLFKTRDGSFMRVDTTLAKATFGGSRIVAA